MTIEELRIYAKESGLSENKTAELIAELHPDENGKLSLQESIEAYATINYIVDLREGTKAMLEDGKALRNKMRARNPKEENNPSFAALLKDCKEGKIGNVFLHDLQRIGYDGLLNLLEAGATVTVGEEVFEPTEETINKVKKLEQLII